MKNTLFLILSALLFVACGDDSSTSANNSNDGDISSKSSSSSAKSLSSSVAKSSSSRKTVSSSSGKVAELVDPADVIVGSMKDSRDGQKYKTVKIGSQTWMAQNLNYETANSYCYNDVLVNCSKYGRLYTWAAAMDGAGVCPEGWHLPTQTEWNTLLCAVSGSAVGVRLTAGKMLKFTSGWKNWGDGTDSFSFSARPAGGRSSDGRFFDDGSDAYFWSATESDVYNAYSINLENHSNGAYLLVASKSDAFSVRCLKSSN